MYDCSRMNDVLLSLQYMNYFGVELQALCAKNFEYHHVT